jgi:glycosyltransferase involved in cell wall biosynthesis
MSKSESSGKIRVLCLDIEGGHGGSSRSLYELLRHVDQYDTSPEVICRRDSRLLTHYPELGIPCTLMRGLPKVSSLPRFSRNLIVYARFLKDFFFGRAEMLELAHTINKRFDLVHFNHEAFFLLAHWLRHRTKVPFVMHLRTNIRDSIFARWQERLIGTTMDHLVFITKFEGDTFRHLGGRGAGTVIHNVAVSPPPETKLHPELVDDQRFKIACLANYSWDKGLDRLIDVAVELVKRSQQGIVFVMAGDMKLSPSMPGALGRVGAAGGTLADYARSRDVGDMFIFLGHVDNPESVLMACDMLAKPTREDNAWGRDVIEAMAAGKPVIGVGTRELFVLNNRTGFLTKSFSAVDWANILEDLVTSPVRLKELGDNARALVAEKCHGPEQARKLSKVWNDTFTAKTRTTAWREF